MTSTPATQPPPPPAGPEGARNQVAMYLGVVAATEEQLRDALILVAERHERNYEISRGATVLAVWSSEHVARLERQRDRYGHVPSEAAELLRSALLSGTRVGVVGELNDLCDLAVLAEKAEMTWTIIVQGARELHDDELLDIASTARDQTRRQISWLRTMIEHEAPDAIAVVPDWPGQLAASVPKRPEDVAAIPDSIWSPLAAAGLILIVGVFGLAVGKPWLLPSLGPSAALIALSPAHPTARMWNTLAGHILGIAAGFLGIALAGAAVAPSPLIDGQLVVSRVLAATIAILLTMLLMTMFRASHPPATATTLLVALGATATADKALSIVAGVVIVALGGELIRRFRLERRTPSERMAPPRSMAWLRLRRPLGGTGQPVGRRAV
ncbi:MAG TPA: HPP family protein [Candidatus Limnocylindrales bacterium]|nr:HPP family protein [Candidatus Limnocylindrales bacterium]